MEFAGYDESIGERRLQILRDAAGRYLRDPLPAGEPERWFGWRAMTTDGCPIIGTTPARPNVCLATGHNMLGLTLAPVTGKLVAELLSGRTLHLDPAPLSPLRRAIGGRRHRRYAGTSLTPGETPRLAEPEIR